MVLSAISSGSFFQVSARRTEAFDPARLSSAAAFGSVAPNEAALVDPRPPIAAVRPVERRTGRAPSDTFDAASEDNANPQTALRNARAARAQLQGGFSTYDAASAYLAQSLAQDAGVESALALQEQERASAAYRAASRSNTLAASAGVTIDLQIDDARLAHLSTFDVTI